MQKISIKRGAALLTYAADPILYVSSRPAP